MLRLSIKDVRSRDIFSFWRVLKFKPKLVVRALHDKWNKCCALCYQGVALAILQFSTDGYMYLYDGYDTYAPILGYVSSYYQSVAQFRSSQQYLFIEFNSYSYMTSTTFGPTVNPTSPAPVSGFKATYKSKRLFECLFIFNQTPHMRIAVGLHPNFARVSRVGKLFTYCFIQVLVLIL